MRALAGILDWQNQEVTRSEFRHLVAQTTFDLGDWSGEYLADGAALFVGGTKEVPDDARQNQPILCARGQACLLTDGLLENRAELVAMLESESGPLQTAADSAIIAAAFDRWGEDLVQYLEGAFVIVVWNHAERRLWCATDALSLRPLYYHWSGTRFIFASTLRGVLSFAEVSRELDEAVLAASFLGLHRHNERTLYQAIKRCPAAHTLTIGERRDLQLRRYWSLDPHHCVELPDHASYVESFRRELDHAVAFALRTTGNVGIKLSGGLDSTMVAVCAAKLLAEQGKRLQAFHDVPSEAQVFRDPLREHDESAWVRSLEPFLPSVDFHYRHFTNGPVPIEEWARLFETHRVPLRTMPERPSVAEDGLWKSLDLTKMINGLGGNYVASLEALPSGYLTELAWRGRWWRLGREIRGLRAFYGHGYRHLYRETIRRPLGSKWRAGTFNLHGIRGRWAAELQPRLVDAALLGEWALAESRSAAETDCKRRLEYLFHQLMPQHSGAAPSAVAPDQVLATRAPLLSRRLNVFCYGVPLREHIRDGRDRLLMRDALAGLVPESLRWRTTRGHPTPRLWSSFEHIGQNWEVAIRELRRSTVVRHYLQCDEVERNWQRARAGDRSAVNLVVKAVMLGQFLRWWESGSTG